MSDNTNNGIDSAISGTRARRGGSLEFERFWQIICTLRGPHGCPWDIEQTTQSIKSNLIEEAHEAVDAINEGDASHLKEELGDVLLVIGLMVCIEQQAGSFTMSEVLSDVADKLVRRHPHVFGDVTADSPDSVREQWNRIKTSVEGRGKVEDASVLDGVPRSLPAVDRAYKLQKKAAKVGFDWPDIGGALGKLREEVNELEESVETGLGSDRIEHEIGDVLFSAINVARKAGINPGDSLFKANRRFSDRFSSVERHFSANGQDLREVSLNEMEERWIRAKEREL